MISLGTTDEQLEKDCACRRAYHCSDAKGEIDERKKTTDSVLFF